MNLRVVSGVVIGWLVVGIVWGVQTSVGAGLQGQALPLAAALRPALVQSLPWIPVTLAVIWLTIRFPFAGAARLRNVLVHAAAAVVVAYMANVLVVLGFWFLQRSFNGFGPLFTTAARWTMIRLHIALLIYAAIAAVTQWVLYHRAARDRELRLARIEGQLAQARLQALNAQIRPHFLFNTLHAMGQLWRSGRSDEADAVLDHLGRLFHKVQSSTTETGIPLADELDMVREYLAIEQTRFRDRMTVVVHVDDAALDCRVPPLILQPLVENAVRHGISAASSAGRLDVEATLRDGRLVITVRDDGPGIHAPSRSAGSGTGLRITRERLEQLYGESARFTIDSPPGGGTTVILEIPADVVGREVHGA
ncbi:MAG: histidine kinase [Gemmatimonadetes bacterium]|nr:histidine kinase [Gemmatimonadota bacterium]